MAFDTRLHFRLPEDYDPEQLDDLLIEKFAFIAEPPIAEKWVFYDTFDWRLFNRSMVLLHAGQAIVLNDLADGESLNGLTGHSAPQFVWDLPESSLRQRLEPIVKVRAFLPLVELDTRFILYRILNADRKTVVRLVYTEVQTGTEEGGPNLVAYLSLWPVRGYPKYKRKLIKYLGRRPKVSSLIADVYISTLKQAGKKPGSYSGKFDLRLKPRMRSSSATKEILRYLLEIMKTNEAGIRADIDTEFLHDYRIAIRRTRSALSQIRKVFPKEETEYFKQSFRNLGQLTNDLRDLDVYLLSESEFEALLPEEMREDIVLLFDYLRTLREIALEEVIISFSSPEYAKAMREWEEFLNKPSPKKGVAANAAVPIVDLARKRIYGRYRKVIEVGDIILTHTQDDLLHALRIECKKLRYLMEFFATLFPKKKMARLIGQLKKLQDNLGEFSDLSVQQEYLMNMAEKLPMDDVGSRKALVATGYLVENLNNKQKAVKDNFANTFTQFASPANQDAFRRLFSVKGKKKGRR